MGVFSTIKNLFTGKQARATDSYNPFVPDWFYAGSDGTKVPVNQSTALNYSAVYACCNVKSKDVAMLPWDVYMRQGNLRKLAFWHDQYFLIKNEPNSDMTSFDFRRTILFDKYWWGDGAGGGNLGHSGDGSKFVFDDGVEEVGELSARALTRNTQHHDGLV